MPRNSANRKEQKYSHAAQQRAGTAAANGCRTTTAYPPPPYIMHSSPANHARPTSRVRPPRPDRPTARVNAITSAVQTQLLAPCGCLTQGSPVVQKSASLNLDAGTAREGRAGRQRDDRLPVCGGHDRRAFRVRGVGAAQESVACRAIVPLSK